MRTAAELLADIEAGFGPGSHNGAGRGKVSADTTSPGPTDVPAPPQLLTDALTAVSQLRRAGTPAEAAGPIASLFDDLMNSNEGVYDGAHGIITRIADQVPMQYRTAAKILVDRGGLLTALGPRLDGRNAEWTLALARPYLRYEFVAERGDRCVRFDTAMAMLIDHVLATRLARQGVVNDHQAMHGDLRMLATLVQCSALRERAVALLNRLAASRPPRSILTCAPLDAEDPGTPPASPSSAGVAEPLALPIDEIMRHGAARTSLLLQWHLSNGRLVAEAMTQPTSGGILLRLPRQNTTGAVELHSSLEVVGNASAPQVVRCPRCSEPVDELLIPLAQLVIGCRFCRRSLETATSN